MQQFCSIALALLLAFAALGDETAYPLQIEGPASSRVEIAELDDEESFARRETSSRVELCLKQSLSLVYRGGRPPVQGVNEVS